MKARLKQESRWEETGMIGGGCGFLYGIAFVSCLIHEWFDFGITIVSAIIISWWTWDMLKLTLVDFQDRIEDTQD